MQKKVSEKLLLFSVACFITGIVVLLKAQVVAVPVRVSEIGILLSAIAVGLIVYSIYLFRKSFVKG